MGVPVIQTSFNSGEWAPALFGRVDLQKYHSGAALIRNFFTDYRGGLTTRPGTRYVLQSKSNVAVRLIPFQASFTVAYVLEFGPGYIRFINSGAYVLEGPTSITAASGGPPIQFTDNAHGYSTGDWIFVQRNYYIVQVLNANIFTLTDLFGNAINTNPFTLPVSAQRVYTITTTYAASELFQIKFAQSVNQMILVHANHPPALLTLNTATNWTLANISFGSSLNPPTSPSGVSTLGTGTVSFVQYVVTAVDINGQESAPSSVVQIGTNPSMLSTANPWTNTVSWTASVGATSYNIYRTIIALTNAPPAGADFGFVGNVTGTSFQDTSIVPDFSQAPPLVQNPFNGSGVQSITQNLNGQYAFVPAVMLTGGGGSGAQAQATAAIFSPIVTYGGSGGFSLGTIWTSTLGPVVKTTALGPGGTIAAVSIVNHGAVTGVGVSLPASLVLTNGSFFIICTVVWGVLSTGITAPGTGYGSAPAVGYVRQPGDGFGANATATAVLGSASAGNPQVAGFYQQRLVLAGPVGSPQQINMSQPGSYYNFNISTTVTADDAITATLVSGVLGSIKAVISAPAGLLVLTDKNSWLVNGGSAGSPATAIDFVANAQAYVGSADLPPIIANYDVLYIQSKGSIVRDIIYDFYRNIYSGTDISVLSSHLFYGFNLVDWAWAEEPFRVVWATRNDGTLLSLTFLKEQELVAWTHSDTLGAYKSVASITESTQIGNADAVYVAVQRQINGQTVNYIERMVELNYPNDYKSSWQVDAGIGYNGPAATTFSGAQHLGGQIVTGLADGVPINFTMPISGTFVFGPGGTAGLTTIASASIVTVGLAFLPQIQTLPLDMGEPTIQTKRKKINAVTVRTKQALGLQIGRLAANAVNMKDLVIGNVGTMSNQSVTGLVTGDARTIVDPLWDVYGQYLIQQPLPYPATVLAVIPEISGGDKDK